ncbi:unnamed protein product [Prorocentrum cordatum]|uniref:Uncharacterized protein n=1 Tax=Prorocentrum cordatum TaxID=2364126 RepID=A0ABN9W9J5_9DINO|nr:unnamed protein product [Polarella glacialis]
MALTHPGIRRGSASGWEACREDTACGAADHATDLEKHGRRSLRDKLPAAASCSCVEHDSHAAHLSIPQPFRPSMETCGPLGERWSPPTTSLKSLQTVLYSVWQKCVKKADAHSPRAVHSGTARSRERKERREGPRAREARRIGAACDAQHKRHHSEAKECASRTPGAGLETSLPIIRREACRACALYTRSTRRKKTIDECGTTPPLLGRCARREARRANERHIESGLTREEIAALRRGLCGPHRYCPIHPRASDTGFCKSRPDIQRPGPGALPESGGGGPAAAGRPPTGTAERCTVLWSCPTCSCARPPSRVRAQPHTGRQRAGELVGRERVPSRSTGEGTPEATKSLPKATLRCTGLAGVLQQSSAWISAHAEPRRGERRTE